MINQCPRVVVALVAYNRAALLSECLDALADQTRPVDGIVVVDNASTDDTPQVISRHRAVTSTKRLSHNTGGAGGFAAAIALAVATEDADLVWIMDDDTIPTPQALEKLLKARADYPGTPTVLASRAVWVDGQTHPMNTHRQRPLLEQKQITHANSVAAIPVRAASFVSILVDARAVIEDGLPEADYFIWNDDLEYTARLLRNRVGLYVPDSVVEHRTKALAGATDDPGDRFFYEARNKFWFLSSPHLRIHDRILWGGSMVLRWARMFRRAKNRQKMFSLGFKGIKAALTSPPTPTVRVLAQTAVSDLVEKVDRGRLQRGPVRVLFAGSSGGHLAQLLNLKDWYKSQLPMWLTFATPDAIDALSGQKVVWAEHSPQRKIGDLFRSLLLSFRTIKSARPDLVVSAGASLGLFAILSARLRGIPTIYIEVFDRVEVPSWSAKICYYLADDFCVQWDEQLKIFPKAHVIGPLL